MKTTPKRAQWAKSRKATMQGLPIKPSAEAERLYKSVLQKAVQRMTRDYQRELKATLKPFVAQDANAGAQLGKMFSHLDKKWGKFFAKLAETAAGVMVRRVDRLSKKSLEASLGELSGGLTIKAPKLPESMITALQAATARNVGLIKSIQGEYHQKVEQIVFNQMGDAQAIYENALTVVDKVYFIGETVEERAALIARDQVAKLNTSLAAERAKAAGITQFKWRHSGASADPRELHLRYDGQIFDYDDLPIIDERTGERGLPGQLINCHPGHSRFELTDGCMKLYRRWYAGKLLSFILDNGVVLEATPNHPILTSRGWVAAHLINLEDDLIECRKKGVNVHKNDIQNGVAKIDDVFNAAIDLFGGTTCHAGLSRLEFHGDSTDDKVDIINVCGNLPFIADAAVIQHFCKLILAYADSCLAGGFSAPCDSPFDEFAMASFLAPDGSVRSLCTFLSKLRGELAGAYKVGLGLVSYIDSMFAKDFINRAPGARELFRQLEDAHAALVQGNNPLLRKILEILFSGHTSWDLVPSCPNSNAEVVRINAKALGNGGKVLDSVKHRKRTINEIISIDFSGHVFNLETLNNWYTVGGIASHNCRCFQAPVLSFGE